MSTEESLSPGQSKTVTASSVVIRVESGESALKSAGRRLLVVMLTASILMNVMFIISSAANSLTDTGSGVRRQFHSGTRAAADKLAIIRFSGTITPPFTERWLKQIKEATDDDDVKGVLLAVDSPGGLVADSHQLYHELQKLREKKPIYVAMKRLAASGGYYIAMGIGPRGKIFAEPTTWTGSIGVIIPRYNAQELASKVGVTSEPLATGPLKDTLSPFRDLTQQERDVWEDILQDSFERFVNVIADNRSSLNGDQVRELATGQIYTTSQALKNGLVDDVGYEEDALAALASELGLEEYEAVEYSSPQTLLDVLLSGKAKTPRGLLDDVLDASTPKALYYCSWNPWIPATARSQL
ncbi:MAG: signal peptide peptidase SppA [Planctomycetaceae bacterium]